MAGTILFAILPLYLTSWRDAVYDGALLVISFAFSSDAVFRCLDPANKKRRDSLTVFFAVASMAILALGLLQYGPIANDLRKEKLYTQRSLESGSILPLALFEKERSEDENAIPNNSTVLLICSLLAEFSVIIFEES